MTVSAALARVYASAPADDNFVETLALWHPDFSGAATHYLTTRAAPFAANLETGFLVTFIPFPFAVQLPGQSGEGQQNLVLALDNVDQMIVDELERAAADSLAPITAVYRVYTESDTTAPAFVLPALTINDVTVTTSQASATAGRTDVLNRPFPALIYTVAQFPGLDR